MATETSDTHDRYPTTGAVSAEYGRYELVQTGGEALIYDEKRDAAWIQAAETLDLDAWR